MPRYRIDPDGSERPEDGKAGPSGSAAWAGGGSHAWRVLRLAAMRRDGYACRRCGRRGVRAKRGAPPTRGLEVHHRIPRAQGGPDELGNVETLCRSCHDAADAEIRRAGRGSQDPPGRVVGRVLRDRGGP